MSRKLIACFLITVWFVNNPALTQMQPVKLTITNRQILSDVPSASGVEFLADSVYIIGDNSPWLFKLDEKGVIADTILIHPLADTAQQIIPKPVKPDFEAMTLSAINGQLFFYIFGSGSKSPYRELLTKVNVDNKADIRQYELADFFAQLKLQCQLTNDQLNIEAAVSSNDSIYLFNRGNNSIISFSLVEFENHISSKNGAIHFKSTVIDLPLLDSIQTGFSGACLVAEKNLFVFTASAENTANWIDDGAIAGSIIGVIDLKNFNVLGYTTLTDGKNNLPVKVESVAVKSFKNNKIDLILVTDQDGEASELIHARLIF